MKVQEAALCPGSAWIQVQAASLSRSARACPWCGPFASPRIQGAGSGGMSWAEGLTREVVPSGSIHRYGLPSGWMEGATTA